MRAEREESSSRRLPTFGYPRLGTGRAGCLPMPALARAMVMMVVVGCCNRDGDSGATTVVVTVVVVVVVMMVMVMEVVVMVVRRVGNYGERAFRRGRASVVVSEPRVTRDGLVRLSFTRGRGRRPRFASTRE